MRGEILGMTGGSGSRDGVSWWASGWRREYWGLTALSQHSCDLCSAELTGFAFKLVQKTHLTNYNGYACSLEVIIYVEAEKYRWA